MINVEKKIDCKRKDDINSKSDSSQAFEVGVNKVVRQKEVIDVIRDNNLGMCVVVESHVKVLNLKNVCSKTFGNWDWVSNNRYCEVGTRIIVGWDPKLFEVLVIAQSRQVIHCYIRVCGSNYSMYIAFIYAASRYIERRVLWDDLKKHSLVVKKEAWCILGDFNVAMKNSDYSEGCSKICNEVDEFIECINFIEVEDLNSTRFHFTWNKSPTGNKGLLKKLERVMVNLKFLSDQPLAHVVFKPYRTFDHCPAILNTPNCKMRWKPSFRFVNFITNKEEFLPLVFQKLKLLKKHCRDLCNKYRGSGKKIKELRKDLGNKQMEIDLNPLNDNYRKEHANILYEYNVACNDEEKLLSQRAKIKWLSDGDNNTKFFHSCLKSRNNRNRILMILDEDGRWIRGNAMKEKFVNHFNNFLGCEDITDLSLLNDDFFQKKLDKRVALSMIRVVTDEEVMAAMFDIDDNHAPGPDGFSSKFFKKNSLGDVVSHNQSAFIPGRSILDNILLAQELMVGYKSKSGVPKCTLKVDIQKAYDTVDWKFLNRILLGFGKRGLRQGDPLSPYLFTMVMEVFNLILLKKIEERQNFKYHFFSYGNGNSARVIKCALEEFKSVSGLKASMEKVQIFFSCVKPNMRRIILVLVDKIKVKVLNWKNKMLSFAGRLQLINLVLTSIHVYWASIFKIPIATIKEIEKICRSFLWVNEFLGYLAKEKHELDLEKVFGGKENYLTPCCVLYWKWKEHFSLA
ncbi:hypothetical protein Lser_V15G04034 [Lactuca serriola]